MRKFFSNKYNNYFYAGLLGVVVTFLSVRPLNSPWHPFIAGDGLGYYAYLPAKFIHNDPGLDFKWFNRVYNANYVYSSFDNPEDNLLVQYKGKRINKYYQGLAFIWMPFFIGGHILAKTLRYPPDGFSLPYQYAIGLASLFYLLSGLLLLRFLLLRLFMVQWISVVVPFIIFYGSPLYTYGIYANTLSHAYSFTFVTGFIYFALRFFRDPGRKTLMLLLTILFFVITVCIRPLNGLSILVLPAFIPREFLHHKIVFEKLRLLYLLPLLVIVTALWYQFSLTHIQTGSLFAYTYTDEKFDFVHNHFAEALVSYHMGLLNYFPVIFIGYFALLLTIRRGGGLLFIVFTALLFLYSSWWYWPIVKRAMIDFYALPAIGFASIFYRLKSATGIVTTVLLAIIPVFYFQFKNWQIGAGIIDEFLTHKEIFFRNFFRTKKANIYPVPPSSIIRREFLPENFDNTAFNQTQGKDGKALLLDPAHYIQTVLNAPFPKLFSEAGRRKVRISFDMNCETGPGQVHVFLDFVNQRDSSVLQIPFYIAEDHLHAGYWDHKEFGYDLVDRETLNANKVSRIKVTLWNVDAKRNVLVDNLRLEYLLCNEAFETNK